MCPSCTRDTDGIAAKLLRCGIASEALRRNMPLRCWGWFFRAEKKKKNRNTRWGEYVHGAVSSQCSGASLRSLVPEDFSRKAEFSLEIVLLLELSDKWRNPWCLLASWTSDKTGENPHRHLYSWGRQIIVSGMPPKPQISCYQNHHLALPDQHQNSAKRCRQSVQHHQPFLKYPRLLTILSNDPLYQREKHQWRHSFAPIHHQKALFLSELEISRSGKLTRSSLKGIWNRALFTDKNGHLRAVFASEV